MLSHVFDKVNKYEYSLKAYGAASYRRHLVHETDDHTDAVAYRHGCFLFRGFTNKKITMWRAFFLASQQGQGSSRRTAGRLELPV